MSKKRNKSVKGKRGEITVKPLEYQEGMALLRHFETSILGIQAFFIPLTIAGFAINVEEHTWWFISVGIASISGWIIFVIITYKYIRPKVKVIREYIKGLHANESGGLIDQLTPHGIDYSIFIFIVGIIICLLWVLRISNIYFLFLRLNLELL